MFSTCKKTTTTTALLLVLIHIHRHTVQVLTLFANAGVRPNDALPLLVILSVGNFLTSLRDVFLQPWLQLTLKAAADHISSQEDDGAKKITRISKDINLMLLMFLPLECNKDSKIFKRFFLSLYFDHLHVSSYSELLWVDYSEM